MSDEITLEDFAEITLDMVERDGLGAYRPTLCMPEDAEIQIIEGVPAHVSQTDAIRHLCVHPSLHGKHFYIAVLAGPNRIDLAEMEGDAPPRFLSILRDDRGDLVVSKAPEEAYAWWNQGDAWLPES